MLARLVALTKYNGELYIEPFLASLCGQDWSNVRFVMSDDGSTNGISEKIAALWDVAAIHKNVVARGVIDNFSNAMTKTGGCYVALVGQ